MDIIGNTCRRIKSWVNAQIAIHKAVADAHHAKYTDSDAVNAVATADDYIKNDGDMITGDFHISPGRSVIADLPDLGVSNIFKTNITNGVLRFLGGSSCHNGAYFDFCGKDRSGSKGNITLVYNSFDEASAYVGFWIYKYNGTYTTMLRIKGNKFDFYGNILRNIKNHAHSALTGTKKLVEIDIDSVPYYFEVYPTKA